VIGSELGRGNMWITGLIVAVFAIWEAISTTRHHPEPHMGPV
jgi:hypothetical protein